MTVRELIAQLQLCPPDQAVYIEGDETGDFPVIGADADVRLRFSQQHFAVRLTSAACDYEDDPNQPDG